MDRQHQLALYRAMVSARRIDQLEQEITNRGEAFFTLFSGGHEASAALAPHLTKDDWLHCHYRDKALLLARGLPVRAFFDNLYCKSNSSSCGRQMYGFMSDPKLHILSMVVPVANNALQAVGVAAAIRDQETSPIVYCGIGDGTTQQGEFLEACAEAVRSRLPVLFVVQNNRYAISTRTDGRTFYSLPDGLADGLFGMPIRFADGRQMPCVYEKFREIVAEMRRERRPALIVLDMERLGSHTNADDQSLYRSADDIAQGRHTGDPIPLFESWLLEHGWSEGELAEVKKEAEQAVAQADEEAVAGRPGTNVRSKAAAEGRADASVPRASRDERRPAVDHAQRAQGGLARPPPQRPTRRPVGRGHRGSQRRRVRRDARVEHRVSRPGDQFGSDRSDDRWRRRGASDGRPAARGLRPIRRFPAGGLQPDRLGNGHVVLADRRPVERAGDSDDRLWRLPAGPGPVSRPDHGVRGCPHARLGRVHALDGQRRRRAVECGLRVGTAHGLLVPQEHAEQPGLDHLGRRRPAVCAHRHGPQGSRRAGRHARRLGQYRVAVLASRRLAGARRGGGRSPGLALHFALGSGCRAGVDRENRPFDRRPRRQSDLRSGRRNHGHRGAAYASPRRHAARDASGHAHPLQLCQPDRSHAVVSARVEHGRRTAEHGHQLDPAPEGRIGRARRRGHRLRPLGRHGNGGRVDGPRRRSRGARRFAGLAGGDQERFRADLAGVRRDRVDLGGAGGRGRSRAHR